jgi:hypothetical protein
MGIFRVGHETFRSVWNIGCVHLMRRSRLPPVPFRMLWLESGRLR